MVGGSEEVPDVTLFTPGSRLLLLYISRWYRRGKEESEEGSEEEIEGGSKIATSKIATKQR